MNTTSSVSEILTNTIKPIANSTIGLNKTVKPNSTIGNRIISPVIVDKLLQDYADLIDTSYTAWFAKRFYNMPFDIIHRCASQARQDAKDDPRRLFAYLVKKACA